MRGKIIFAAILLLLTSMPWARAEDCIVESDCGDVCDEKPQPPHYPVGRFSLEDSDAYDQALEDYKEQCEARPTQNRDCEYATVEQPPSAIPDSR